MSLTPKTLITLSMMHCQNNADTTLKVVRLDSELGIPFALYLIWPHVCLLWKYCRHIYHTEFQKVYVNLKISVPISRYMLHKHRQQTIAEQITWKEGMLCTFRKWRSKKKNSTRENKHNGFVVVAIREG